MKNSQDADLSSQKNLRKAGEYPAPKYPRAEILKTIAAKTGLKKAQVARVFEELSFLVKDYLDVEGASEFLIPKLGIKIKKVHRKPTKSRLTVSPITEEKVLIPSKPARWDIKVLALKKLKEIISQQKLP